MSVITCKERPILFSAPMVRAILAGTKTQTRRIIKPQPTNAAMQGEGIALVGALAPMGQGDTIRCPYGQPGDRLYVRETFALVNSECGPGFAYRADGEFDQPEYDGEDFGGGPSFNYAKYPGDYCMWYGDLMRGAEGHKWTPSIHMPRWASRIDIEVTGVRVERLNDISEADAMAEGLWHPPETDLLWLPCAEKEKAHISPIRAYRDLWQSINGADSWDANPWVWVVEFKRLKP